jgi:hypothetical protein
MVLALLAAAAAASLTVPVGTSWLFRIERGQPVAARPSTPDSVPARGEIRLTARRMLGTTLTALNNSATAFTFRATLIAADGKTLTARSCVLPANNRLAMESWPQAAVAVRVSDFRPTTAANCR